MISSQSRTVLSRCAIRTRRGSARFQVTHDRRFGVGIECARGFIHDQDARCGGERASDFETLSLAAGEVSSAFLHPAVVSAGAGGDDVVDERVLCGADDLRFWE